MSSGSSNLSFRPTFPPLLPSLWPWCGRLLCGLFLQKPESYPSYPPTSEQKNIGTDHAALEDWAVSKSERLFGEKLTVLTQ